MRNLVVLLGVPVDNLDFQETLERIDRFVQIGRQMHRFHQVATVNTDFLVKAAEDPDLRRLLQSVHLATPDGMPLIWASRLLGNPLKERVAGADLVPALARQAAAKGYSIYLFGAGPGIAQKAAQVLQQRYPGLVIAGVASPPYTPIQDMDRSALDDIRAAKPDLLLVALGNPKQEKWIEMYGCHVNVPVIMGIGGSLDFIAGNVKRAPVWMQKSGFEWLYRIMQEPRRLWRRYVIDLFVFTDRFVRQWWYLRGAKRTLQNRPAVELILAGGKALLNIRGNIGIENTEEFKKMGRQALAVTPEIEVDLSGVDFVDSVGAGALVDLANQASEMGGKLILVSVPPKIRQNLNVLGLDTFFRITTDGNAQSDARPLTA